MKTVTIAIPSLHRPDLTARCLEFIAAQTMPASEWEVVVIENDARPGKILPDPLPPNTQRIELPTNEGTTGSINRALAATTSKYVLLLNNDIELAPDYLETLVRVMDNDPGLGFATGKLLRATQRTFLDGAGDAMLMGGGAFRLGSMDEDRGQFDKPQEVLLGCGAAALYRRVAFDACGGLDPDFFAYADDVDLALRVHLVGYTGMYVQTAIAYHIGSATMGAALSPKFVEWMTRNQLFVIWKDYPLSVRSRALSRILLYQCLWLAYVLKSGFFSAYVRGVRDAFAGRTLMRRKHAEVMGRQQIEDEKFFQLLAISEQQVRDWHFSRPPALRSALLNAYFRVFTPKRQAR